MMSGEFMVYGDDTEVSATERDSVYTDKTEVFQMDRILLMSGQGD